MGRFGLALWVMALWLAAAGGVAGAQEHQYAPLDQPGPALSVPQAALDASLTCTGDLAAGTRPAVLLIHGTNLDYESNFAWNYARAFAGLGWAHCGVDLPAMGMDDVQTAAEHVVHAIRTVAARSGRPIQIVGFSQGGMIGRWALRWWPDTRPLVEEIAALAPSNHGTVTAIPSCQAGCVPAYWQQRSDSAFIAALNSRTETFDSIDYTNVRTRYDEVVQPNVDDSGSSSLRGGANVRNVATQDVCPANTAEHLSLGSYDPVGWALVHDALSHDGPADPARVAIEVCAQAHMPAVDPAAFPEDYGRMLQAVGEASDDAPRATEEPPLRCYVTASCAAATGGVTRAPEPANPAGLPATGAGIGLALPALFGAALLGRRR